MFFKNQKFLILILLFLVIIAAYFLFFSQTKSKYVYGWQKENIQFNSNVYLSLKDSNYMPKKTFLISPTMTSFSSAQNTNYTNDFLIPFLVVLSGSDKNAVTFIRVYDVNSDLSYCSTNFGNPKDEKIINAEECFSFLSNPAFIKIKLEPINSSKQFSEVILEEESIIINPKDFSDLKKIFILIATDLIPNYSKIIKNSNLLSSYVHK